MHAAERRLKELEKLLEDARRHRDNARDDDNNSQDEVRAAGASLVEVEKKWEVIDVDDGEPQENLKRKASTSDDCTANQGARKKDARVVTPLSDRDGSTDFDLCALPGSLGLEVGGNEQGELAVVRVLATSQFINNVQPGDTIMEYAGTCTGEFCWYFWLYHTLYLYLSTHSISMFCLVKTVHMKSHVFFELVSWYKQCDSELKITFRRTLS